MTWPELYLSALRDVGASIADGLRAQLEHAVSEFVEEELLRAGPDAFRAAGFDHVASDHGQWFVDFENTLAATSRTTAGPATPSTRPFVAPTSATSDPP